MAGQDPLLHYTTLCLFCLKVFGGEEQWEQKRAHSLKEKDETVAVSVKIKFPPAIDQVLQFKARSQKLFQVESNMESARSFSMMSCPEIWWIINCIGRRIMLQNNQTRKKTFLLKQVLEYDP